MKFSMAFDICGLWGRISVETVSIKVDTWLTLARLNFSYLCLFECVTSLFWLVIHKHIIKKHILCI